jgi:hypothetical protein
LSSYFDTSGLVSARVTCTSKSQIAIPRFNRSRQSSEGQVAQDPEGLRFGTSAFSQSKGAREHSEIPSCEGSHGDGAEGDTWRRDPAFGF